MPLMLDLFAGIGWASRAMRERGWQVITVDNNPAFCPTTVEDVHLYSYRGPQPDLVWASPPCEEFSHKTLPWLMSRNLIRTPSMSLIESAIRVISEIRPTFWVIENVKGSIPYLRNILGTPAASYPPVFLWRSFPDLGALPVVVRME